MSLSPSPSLFPHPSVSCPVGVVVQKFSVCFSCCMEESSLIMKHRERGREGSAVPHRSSKFLSGPVNAREAKNTYIISVIYFTSVGTGPDYPPDFRLGFRERLFLFWQSEN